MTENGIHPKAPQVAPPDRPQDRPQDGPRVREQPPPGFRPSHRQAIAWLVLCTLMWSIAGLVSRQLEQAKSLEVTFWRSLFCFLAMGLGMAWHWRRKVLQVLWAMGRWGLFSGAMWAVMFTCFMIALTRTSVANTVVVMSLAPLLAAIMARLFLRTPIEPSTLFAIAMAGCGVWWMVREGITGDGYEGMLIAAGVPLASAANLVVLRAQRAQVELIPAILVGAWISCLITLPWSIPFEASSHDLAWLALLGVFQLAIPCALLVWVARFLPPHEIALICLLEVVLGPIWTWLGADEEMPLATVQGGMLVIAGLAFNAMRTSWSKTTTAS
ncbi:MAG: DMT family transporter, partial [Betaproteobacteria bacterium]|nr:DMT family transporter [Betaproteobacteria bacterium]